MSSVPRRRLKALSEQLSLPTPNPGTFENIPKVRQIAPDSTGQTSNPKGANSPLGIGRASAHQFANNGARAIYICDFSSDYLAVHERELNSLYPTVDIHTRQFDASDEAAIKAVIDEAIEKYERLDILFANAAIVGSNKLFWDIEADEFMKTMKTNILRYPLPPPIHIPKTRPSKKKNLFTPSVFLATKHASTAMQHTTPSKPHPSGSIISTASIAALRSNAGSTDYSASKAAVISLMQTTAYQLAGTGIRCNAICPGLIETGMTSALYE
ncbi:MAG: hypothetical protein Q9224_007135, partial [Gallowayella concinna]